MAKPAILIATHEQAWHVFRDENGALVETKCTKREYNDLSLKGAGAPSLPDARWRWLYSYLGFAYNTPDGLFKDNSAVDLGGAVFVSIAGDKFMLHDARVEQGIVKSEATYRDVLVAADGDITAKAVPSSSGLESGKGGAAAPEGKSK